MRAGHAHRSQAARIREIGVTRLSLGVENFDDEILEFNGRAHRSPEIYRAYELARALGFPQINIDLIAGMVGETEDNWQRLRRQDDRAAAGQRHHLPDGVAVQHDDQQDLLKGTGRFARAGRRLADEAALGAATRSRRSKRPATPSRSAYTAVKDRATRFVYRDRLWQGADMSASAWRRSGTSTASTSRTWTRGRPTRDADRRAARCRSAARYRPTDEERLIREIVLQLKRGSVRPAYFRDKYGVDILRAFPRPARLARGRRLSAPAVLNDRGADARRAAARRRTAASDSSCPSTPGFGTRRRTGTVECDGATVRWSMQSEDDGDWTLDVGRRPSDRILGPTVRTWHPRTGPSTVAHRLFDR